MPRTAFIVATDSTLWITHAEKRLTVELDVAIDPARLIAGLSGGIADLSAVLGTSDAAALAGAMTAEFGQGIEVESQTEVDPRVLRLAEVLRTTAPPQRQDVPLRRFVVAGRQALWTGANPRLALEALRFFVSMMPDPHRRGAYASLATGRMTIAVLDQPAPMNGGAEFERLAPLVAPAELEHRQGEWTIVSNAGDGLDPHRGSRLGAALVERVEHWPQDRPVLTFAFGRTAAPNLAVLGPGDTDGDFLNGVKGVASDESLARVKCVAEGAERFLAGDVNLARLRHARAQDLEGAWLHPGEVAKYSLRQMTTYGLVAFDATEREWWVRCDSLGGSQWVPAALVYAPFPQTPKTLSQNEVWSRRKQSWQARSLRNASRKRSERS